MDITFYYPPECGEGSIEGWSIPVAIPQSCQYMKTIASHWHEHDI